MSFVPSSGTATRRSRSCTLFIRRTVYVGDGDVVRLREPVKAKVWVQVDPDGDGPAPRKWEPTVMVIPEGWYCGHLEKRGQQ